MDRIDFLRHEVPPVGSLLYVFFTETTTPVPLYLDRAKTQPITQPIVINNDSVHFYADNTRVDMRIEHSNYPAGFVFIEDQILYDPADAAGSSGQLSSIIEIASDNTTNVVKPVGMQSGTEDIYLNGVLLREGVDNDYLINTNDIDFVNGWKLFINDVIEIKYYI